MTDPLFKKVIRDTLLELPADLKAALATVEINVRDIPSAEQLKRSGLNAGDDLFGLFEGLSLKEWPLGQDRFFPDRITLFEEPLKRHYAGREELARQIRATLIHELGHYFGFSERELRDRGLG